MADSKTTASAGPEFELRKIEDSIIPDQATIGKVAMRKALWHILPLILLAYLCAYMDRVNVSFAAARRLSWRGSTS